MKATVPGLWPSFEATHVATSDPVHFMRRGYHSDKSMPNEFKMVRKLGSAGEGRVYLMISNKTGTLSAIKIFKKRAEARTAAHFPREALAQIHHLKDHPNIVKMFSAEITIERECWIQLEWCNGGTLSEQITRFQRDFRSSVPDQFVLHVFIQLAEALAYIHHGLRYVGKNKYAADTAHKGLIHGDLKPDNILLRLPACGSPDGLPTIVLADFGMAQPTDKVELVSGTPGWYSPEAKAMFEGLSAPPMSQKTDVYVFGLIMCRLMSENQWRTGANPESMRLPGYEHLVWLDVIQSCVRVNPAARSAFNTDSLLHVVNAAKVHKRGIQGRDGPLDRMYFKNEMSS